MNQPPAKNYTASHRANSPIYVGLLPSSPIGPMWVAVSELGLMMVDWSMSQADFSQRVGRRFHTDVFYDESHSTEALQQLSEYLSGSRRQFTIPLDLLGMSPFQVQVLHLTSQIPYGQTSTYKKIAVQLGKVHAARAVGRVESTNPIPLVIPCHRVLGTDGSLHGYGGPGGIKLKAWLLKLEQSSV
ncbi:MAG: methylated-DNA--[protein]-cysteine S-methyltransferase [Anaerolineales bacterium]